MRQFLLVLLSLGIASCAGLPNRDPLVVDVTGIEPLPSDGLELRLQIRVRIQNPNDVPIEFTGAALSLDLNNRRLANGVSDSVGSVPRYGEIVFTIPVTISAFNVARQLVGFVGASNSGEVSYRVRGKLESGFLGTRRFEDEGTFNLNLPQ